MCRRIKEIKTWIIFIKVHDIPLFLYLKKEDVLTMIGYRNDNYGGSMVSNAQDIIKFECIELGNSDIFKFCHDTYKLVNINIDNNKITDNISIVVNFLETHFKTKKLYGKWLASKSDVLQYYYDSNNDNDDIDMYEIPDNALCISDLDDQGKLYVSNKKFIKKESIIR